jgi:hypothetical protein
MSFLLLECPQAFFGALITRENDLYDIIKNEDPFVRNQPKKLLDKRPSQILTIDIRGGEVKYTKTNEVYYDNNKVEVFEKAIEGKGINTLQITVGCDLTNIGKELNLKSSMSISVETVYRPVIGGTNYANRLFGDKKVLIESFLKALGDSEDKRSFEEKFMKTFYILTLVDGKGDEEILSLIKEAGKELEILYKKNRNIDTNIINKMLEETLADVLEETLSNDFYSAFLKNKESFFEKDAFNKAFLSVFEENFQNKFNSDSIKYIEPMEKAKNQLKKNYKML